MKDNNKHYLMLMNNNLYNFEESKEDGFYYWPIERKKALEWLKNDLTVYIYENVSHGIIYKCEIIEKKLFEDIDNSLSKRESRFVIKKSDHKTIEDKVFIKLGNFVAPKNTELLSLDLLMINELKTIRKGHDISDKENLIKYLEYSFYFEGDNYISIDSEVANYIGAKNKLEDIFSHNKDPKEQKYVENWKKQLSNFIRANYRTNLFNRNNRYNDINNQKFDELSKNNEGLFEAAHIVDVEHIKKFIYDHEKDLRESKNLDNIKPDLDLMLSNSNGIFIPHKYHYYFDRDIIYLNSQLEFKINPKFKEIINVFNEEFDNLKVDLQENKDIVRLVELRNKYRLIN